MIKKREIAEKLKESYEIWTLFNEPEYVSEHDNNAYSFALVLFISKENESYIHHVVGDINNNAYNGLCCYAFVPYDACEETKTVLRSLECPSMTKEYSDWDDFISLLNQTISDINEDFVCYIDAKDRLSIDALRIANDNIAKETELLYSDSDYVDEIGFKRENPFFKPDWSPLTLLEMNYLKNLALYKTQRIREKKCLFRSCDEMLYDFALRFTIGCNRENVVHVSRILFHERQVSNDKNEGLRRIQDRFIEENGIDAFTEKIDGLNEYRVVFCPDKTKKISIIIPSKDHKDLLEQCISSIEKVSSYKNYEIIVVDNGSENKDEIEELLSNRATYIYEPMEFNFSKMCNLGVSHAIGDYILLLNDDVEVIQKDWMERLLGTAMQKDVGAVGAKLYYPDSKLLQHDGIINLIPGPTHAFSRMNDEKVYYHGWNRFDRECLAVTGACLLISKKKYMQVDGLDESLSVTYNDVEFCIKLYENGYYNVLRNDVCAKHHESLSRGNDKISDEKMARLKTEQKYMYDLYPQYIGKDPFYNTNLTQKKEDFSIDTVDGTVPNSGWKLLTKSQDELDSRIDIQYEYCERVHDRLMLCFKLSGLRDEDRNKPIFLVLKRNDEYLLFIKSYQIECDVTWRRDVFFADVNIFKGEVASYQLGISMDERMVLLDDILSFSEEHVPFTYKRIDRGIIKKWKRGEFVGNIDELNRTEDAIYLHGWALKLNEDNNQYFLRKFIYVDDKNAYVFSTHLKYRSDIVGAYFNVRNALTCGMEALIDQKNANLPLNGGKWGILLEDMRTHSMYFDSFREEDENDRTTV